MRALVWLGCVLFSCVSWWMLYKLIVVIIHA